MKKKIESVGRNPERRRRVVLLGATGSIGKSTLDVVRQNPEDFEIVCLSASTSAEALKKSAEEFKVKTVYLKEDREALLDFITRGEYDSCVFALSDFDVSTEALVRLLNRKDRKIHALMASKETIVAYGAIFRQMAAQNGHSIIPLDSEPSAIYQCLGGTLDGGESLKKVYLVATGGPFYRNPVPGDQITAEIALKHPVWKMGPKITIDSATLVNKSLELLEICQLFNLTASDVQILIHPQCVIHSMVEMQNGSVLAQAGPPDMRLPIHYGLYWPNGMAKKAAVPPLDFSRIKELNFDIPDLNRFPCLKVALEKVASVKGEERARAARLAFLAADDAAVEAFIGGRIRFTQMASILEHIVTWALRQDVSALTGPETLRKGADFYKRALEEARKAVNIPAGV